MSVDVFRNSNIDAIANEVETAHAPVFNDGNEWNPERFAQEQIRGLVRQVFFSSAAQPVRQVLFTAAEGRTDIAQLCRQVGEAVSFEVQGSVAVQSRDLHQLEQARQQDTKAESLRVWPAEPGRSLLRESARRVRNNLWLLTEIAQATNPGPTNTVLYSRLCELRTEFEYSIVEGPPAGISSEAAALGQLTDGIVLVLAAHKTRRAAAKKIKETLERARTRILGTVLIGRTFPIPAALYRRL